MSGMMHYPNTSQVSASALRDWLQGIFLRLSFSEADAIQAADVLMMADLRGIDSHGVARLSGYVRLVEAGQSTLNPIYNSPKESGPRDIWRPMGPSAWYQRLLLCKRRWK